MAGLVFATFARAAPEILPAHSSELSRGQPGVHGTLLYEHKVAHASAEDVVAHASAEDVVAHASTEDAAGAQVPKDAAWAAAHPHRADEAADWAKAHPKLAVSKPRI